MAMETILAPVVCCLLVLSFDVAHTRNQNLNATEKENRSLNLGDLPTSTSSNSTIPVTLPSNFNENTTLYPSTKWNNESSTNTAATNVNTNQSQTSQSAATWTSSTDSGTLKTTTPSILLPTFTITTPTINTTVNTTVNPTENSSHTVITTMDSANRTTQGLSLNMSERNLTTIFSVVLGVFVLAVVVIMLQKCRHKIQYMHQPLSSTNETDGFVADDDTLVISGGLYDGHPIYDNVPPVPSQPSRFRLEFLQ